jgi:hypothetical protein
MHEAHHAAGLCLAGMVPEQARIDWPTKTNAGHVLIDWNHKPTREAAEPVLIAVLLGPMSDGPAFDWPIDPDRVDESLGQDAEHAARLAKYLKLDHAGWAHVVWKARQLARREDFRRLVVAIADELERVEVLYADDLRRLMAETENTCSV